MFEVGHIRPELRQGSKNDNEWPKVIVILNIRKIELSRKKKEEKYRVLSLRYLKKYLVIAEVLVFSAPNTMETTNSTRKMPLYTDGEQT